MRGVFAAIDGQLGNGTTTSSSTPVQVSLPPGVLPVAVAAGDDHSLALGSNGTLYAWGYNGYGQLGNGTRTTEDTPVTVTFPSGVKAIAIAAGDRPQPGARVRRKRVRVGRRQSRRSRAGQPERTRAPR